MAYATATFGRPFDAADLAQMTTEGWCISNASDGSDEIQMDDEAGAFTDDNAAVVFVYEMARNGSDLHRRALAYLIAPANGQGRTYPLFLKPEELAAVGSYVLARKGQIIGYPEYVNAVKVLDSIAAKVIPQLEASINDPELED